MSASPPRVVALIPGFQEAPRIGVVVREAVTYLPVLVVDDGSTDGTADVAEEAGATVIRQQPNGGKGAALRAGFRRALADGQDAVITLDADGQHDPGEIPAFLAAWKRRPADLLIGRRDFRQMPSLRRLANNLAQRTFSWAVGRHIPDNQSGYRLIGRRLMQHLLESREQGFEFEVEMITTAIRAGYAIDWLPIRTIYRGEPSHIRPWGHVTSFLRLARESRRSVGSPLPDADAQPESAGRDDTS